MNILKITGAYLKRFFQLWFIWFWFVALDAIGLIFDTFVPTVSPPRWLYWFIPAIGFVIANIKLFYDNEIEKDTLINKIRGYEAYEANIKLEAINPIFSHSQGSRQSPFPDVPRSPGGFNQQGLPDWGSLSVRIRFVNIGHESGKPIVEINESKVELPSLFKNHYNVTFYEPSKIDGREEQSHDLYFDVPIRENDPTAFALALKDLVKSNKRYRIAIRYWTRRIDGESEPRHLWIEGDFTYFYQEIMEYWDGFGFKELASIAGGDSS